MSNQDRAAGRVDISNEQIHEDFSRDTNYGGYLCLDQILNAQKPVTGEHDEVMFILVHQVSELWMKLVLHEVSAARELVKKGDLDPSFKMLARVSRIQSQLEQVWSVICTMTPTDYVTFRDQLGHASGFQSYQYRILEFILGNKNDALVGVHRHDPEVFARVETALKEPSLYDEALALLARRGFEIPQDKLDRDWSQPYEPDPAVERAWLQIYQDTNTHWDLYELAEKLVDVEDNFQRWRFRHVKTVERVIGFKRGTGGTSGVQYLRKALDLRFFPELWSLRTSI